MKTSEEICLRNHIYIYLCIYTYIYMLRGMGVGVGSEKSPGPLHTRDGKISSHCCVMPL